MIIYDSVKSEFMMNVKCGMIAHILEQEILQQMGKHTGQSEVDSWKNSMARMYMVLDDKDIPEDAGIAIEYNVPQTSKRVDFIISGYGNDDTHNAVIIELKQWSEVKEVKGKDALVETYTGHSLRKVVHPSYQVWSYASLIRDYNRNVQDKKIGIEPCAYLHNYSVHNPDPLFAEQYRTYIEDAPVFTEQDADRLAVFIKKFIKTGDRGQVIYEIDHGKIRPSKSLQDAVLRMLKGNKEFVMVDDQKVAYEEIRSRAMQSMQDGKKRTVIVQGGPGTGKSVIAVNLLAELTHQGQVVQYASKNSAPREVYKAKLKGKMKKSSVDNLFKGTGIYYDATENSISTILVDEAHRMNRKSGIFHNKGENQIREVIRCAKCSVFFIDESQRVTMDDIGSVAEICKCAEKEGSEIYEMSLTSQFRCNGSNGYLAWIDHVLEIRETANYTLEDIDYDIRIFDDPEEVRKEIVRHNDIDHRSRMLAGYCWNWDKSGMNDSSVQDIQIGDFGMSWNLGNEIFAIEDSSINEVGCIHTSQGLEFEYAGLIIGDDMRYENGHVITDYTKRAKTDKSLKGIKKMAKENPEAAQKRADEIIRNTYRTLMTRGMKGCYVYCTDPKLREYLRTCLKK